MDIEYLKSLKQAKNLTVKELSKLTNIPEGTINNIFSGKTENPSFEVIQKLAIALDADTNYIIYGQKYSEGEHEMSETINAIREIYTEQIRLLTKDKLYLAVLTAFLVLFIATVLLVDLFNGNFGYIRY